MEGQAPSPAEVKGYPPTPCLHTFQGEIATRGLHARLMWTALAQAGRIAQEGSTLVGLSFLVWPGLQGPPWGASHKGASQEAESSRNSLLPLLELGLFY